LSFGATDQFFGKLPASFLGRGDDVGLAVLLIGIFLLMSYNFTSKLNLTQKNKRVNEKKLGDASKTRGRFYGFKEK